MPAGLHVPSSIPEPPAPCGMKVCSECGATFVPVLNHPQQRFCSKRCRRLRNLRRQKEKYQPKPPAARTCLVCGSAFTVGRHAANSLFCSTECRHKHAIDYNRGWRHQHPGYVSQDHAKRRKAKAVQQVASADTVTRRCLNCDGAFTSLWIGNRLCPACRTEDRGIMWER